MSDDVMSTPTARRFVQYGGPVHGDMTLYANAGVDAGVSMALHMREPVDDYVSILFGKERLSLEFYDVESLERLRDLADEGARRLRVSIEMNRQADADTDAAEQTPALVGMA